MSPNLWLFVTRMWMVNTLGWAVIAIATKLLPAVLLTVGCLALTLFCNWRYHESNERGGATRSSADKR